MDAGQGAGGDYELAGFTFRFHLQSSFKKPAGLGQPARVVLLLHLVLQDPGARRGKRLGQIG